MLEKFMFFLIGLSVLSLLIFASLSLVRAKQPVPQASPVVVEMLDLWAEYEVWWCSKDKSIWLTGNCSSRRAGQRHLREVHPTFNGFVLWLKNVKVP